MRAERMPQYLRRFVRVENWNQTHWLSHVAPPAWTDEEGPAWRLGRIQRALGMLIATPTTDQTLDIDGHQFQYEQATKADAFEGMEQDQPCMLSFWPTFDESWNKRTIDDPDWALKTIHASGIRAECPHPNRVEVMGVLNHIWREGFELKLFTQATKGFKYIRFEGQYPNINDINTFVYVIASLDPARGVFVMEQVLPVTFVTRPKKKDIPNHEDNTSAIASDEEE